MSEVSRFGLLELGSNSLKLYLVDMAAEGPDGPAIETVKFPWRIAHEFFAHGRLPESGVDEIVERLGQARDRAPGIRFEEVLAVATGVFRELPGLDRIRTRVKAETGVRIRVISGRDEATLMGRGFRELPVTAPAMLCDLGGATMEWVWLGGAGESVCGSAPLGAIRNHYRFPEVGADPAAFVQRSAEHCDQILTELPSAPSAQLVATGGTARALAQVIGADRIPIATIAELAAEVASSGPPAGLEESRREVFLPGLIILWRTALHCGASELAYGTSAVRHGMVVRLLQLLEKHQPDQLHATQLLRTTDDELQLVAADPDQPPALARGSQVGRYVVVDRLGAGGMGVVYKAVDPELERTIALKVMPVRPGADTAAARDRLLHEAQALARLAHPNVVAVHDVGTVGDDVFVAMELVEGQTLGEWCRDRPRLAELLPVFVAAGRGIAAAHAAGLVHRDFKPDNVIVGADGRVRVLDFGLARAQDDAAATGDSIRATGTPAYMAPEQHAHQPIDARADQFSFCAALYEAVYGVLPFAGDTRAELAAAVTAGKLVDPPDDRRVPGWLRRILLRGLARDPDQRYPSMNALLAELDRRLGQRRVLLALGAALLLAVAGGAWWMGRHEKTTPEVCRGAAELLDGTWDEAVKKVAHDRFLATGRPHAQATFDRVAMLLDGQAAAWVDMWTQACRATRRDHRQSETDLALRTTCLDQRLAEMRELTTRFTGAVDEETVDNAIHATFQLSSIEDCADVAKLARQAASPPPHRVPRTGCGLPDQGVYNPISVGRVWVYDVIDPSTGLPRNQDPKVLTVEELEPIGGCKGDIRAYRMRRRMATGYADRWVEARPMAGENGQRDGQLSLRHRDRWYRNDGTVTTDEYYQPARIRLDDTCLHTLVGASFLDSYDEVDVTPGSECGAEVSRKHKTFDWLVVADGVPIKLALDYSHPECCPDPDRCQPPPDDDAHHCVAKPGGAPTDWICEFDTLEVQRREVDGSKTASYWFAAGVGKIKEYTKGEEIEHLICYTVP